MAEYVEIEKAVNIASVNYGLNHNQAHGFRNDLKRNSEPIPVRCYYDCYWIRQDWGNEVTPPFTECVKDVKVFDQLNIDPCYCERDQEECPDCPFYVNHDQLLQMESEYHDGEPVSDYAYVNRSELVSYLSQLHTVWADDHAKSDVIKAVRSWTPASVRKTEPGQTEGAIELLLAERRRQVEQWGEHVSNHPYEWMSILGEEYGELCRAVNETCFQNPKNPELGGNDNIISEAVQVATVAIAIIEACLGQHRGDGCGKCYRCRIPETGTCRFGTDGDDS